MGKIIEMLRRILCKEYPLWTYGLECEICQMTLISSEDHLKEARKRRTVKQHQGKIPILKK